ncbi:MAG TPA: hypothetical protein VEM96_10085 [Pyrinomonadaceae bacterium]|nr:hypothetical protein [Pyrinomonadaceae bacterium]
MSRKQKRMFWPTLIGTAVLLSALLLALGHTRKPKGSGLSETATGQLTLVRGPVQNVRFTVYDVGIYPHQLRVRKGIVGIAIEDRTGSSRGLLIELENGNGRVPIGQVMRPTNQLRGRDWFTLDPGRYRISNASRQTSESELIVEP